MIDPLGPVTQGAWMQLIRNIRAMQRAARRWKRQGIPLALVPTMGYLHAGHLSLVTRARRCVGRRGKVVVSIYVNPTQFAPHEDLARYPQDLPRDLALCRAGGADVVFAPSDREMYPREPEQPFSTYVTEEAVSRGLEGASRPTHFRGVATIVAKLFNLALPDVTVFGAKDFQQAAVVRRLIRDLNFPVRLVVAQTVREPDGLAMSSRNKFLSDPERRQAVVLWQAIQAARQKVRNAAGGVGVAALKRELVRQMERHPDARVDYLEFVDPVTLRLVTRARQGVRMVLAVYVGRTRLIDNAAL